MKEKNLKISPKLIALLVAGGIALAPIPGTCLTDNSYEPGTFVKWVEQQEENEYGEYIVKEGDNLSKISEKVCSHLRIEITPKYWPVLAYLNHYPRVINPGDIIIFPKSAERLIEMNEKLQSIGWTSKYKQTYKVYGIKRPKKRISMEAVADILREAYGDDVCIDPDFVLLYMKTTGLDNKYTLTTNKDLDNNTIFDITDWIPTIEELNQYQESHKPKTKKK